jgi:hypothetical protein
MRNYYGYNNNNKENNMNLLSAIPSGLDVIGNVFGNRARRKEARSQRKFDLDMWNRQNAYNTPRMQMQRLRDAGLNPALMYGQGTTGNAVNQPKATQARLENPISSSGVASGVQLSLMNQQKKLLRSQAVANLQNAATGRSSQKRIDRLVGLEAQSLEMGIKKTQAETGLIIQQERRTLAQTIGQKIENDIKDKSSQSIIKKAAQDANNAVLDGTIKTQEEYQLELKNNLREQGVTDRDHILIRSYVQETNKTRSWFKAAIMAAKAIKDAAF